MCKHADHTNEIIDHLNNDVYHLLQLSINNSISCDFLKESNAPEKPIVIDLLALIKNEFQSLITYEQKLVFPSVLKVFLAKKSSESLPNLSDLLQLTKSKEHKLMHHIDKLALVLKNKSWNTALQDNLVKSFLDNFVNEKMQWNKMIQDRVESCGCFKRKYFDQFPYISEKDILDNSGNAIKIQFK